MGVGTNALDFSRCMDNGKIVLVNLAPSNYLSLEQQRLIGTLLITEFYEAALNREQSNASGQNRSRSRGRVRGGGTNESRAVTNQPGVRHHPFWEKTPQFWNLQEQRWRAAEIIMGQPVGHCLIKTASGQFGQARVPSPRNFT
jgi:hypothetical protein